jgi:INO80 complex subunit E
VQLQVVGSVPVSLLSDGHMTPEEVERHLESRQTYLELVPEKAPPTVPTEMFSNDPSLDRYHVFCYKGNISQDCSNRLL